MAAADSPPDASDMAVPISSTQRYHNATMSAASVPVAKMRVQRIGRVVPVGTATKVTDVPLSCILTVKFPPVPTYTARVTYPRSFELCGVTATAFVAGLKTSARKRLNVSVAGMVYLLSA